MNLFDFLKKFGNRMHYFEIYLDFGENHSFTLKLFKNGFISISPTLNYIDPTIDNNFDAYLKDDKYIELYFKKKFYKFIIPFSFDYFISCEKFKLYIPENEKNIELYNKLVKRRDIYIDSRRPYKSVWIHFKRINKKF